MTLNITEGCYVKLRNGDMCGPVRYDCDSPYCWDFGGMSWNRGGFAWSERETSDGDIIEVLPGKPVFIDTPFEVGKAYRLRNGEKRTVEGFALRLSNGAPRHLDGVLKSYGITSRADLLPGAIEDEKEVTVKMSKADEANARLIAAAPELLEAAQGLVATMDYIDFLANMDYLDHIVKEDQVSTLKAAKAAIAKATGA